MEKVVAVDEKTQPIKSVLDPAKQKVQDTAKMVTDKPVMKKFTQKSPGNNSLMLVVVALVVILAGVGTGWFLSGTSNASSTSETPRATEEVAGDVTEMGEASEDNEEAEGELIEASEDDEGTHVLDRSDLGENKDVALVSTTINLQNFVGKRVKVWGETKAGQSSGWLMDVVKIKTVE